MKREFFGAVIAAALVALNALQGASGATLSGELRQWHKVTLTFTGPDTSETAPTNPFLDYRLNVTFTQGSTSYVVPGYYCADGNAANTSASSGNKWRVHFAPPSTGTWNWQASFRQGSGIAVSNASGTPVYFDGQSGSFNVSASNKTGDDFRGKGLLKLAPGKHYLRFSGTGEYWIKGGVDSPEDFLGCSDFDNTVTGNELFPVTNYPAHVGDWNPGDPTWGGGRTEKGKGIIGVLNYLGSQRVNSIYFLPMNLGGDGQNTHPFASTNNDLVYDCSKLDQWQIVFDHAQKKGILLHVVLNEAEAANRNRLDNGTLGTERKLFYRELIARFAHVNGLMWNLCEEGIETFYPASRLISFADYIKSVDPYNHPIGVHNWIKADGIDVVFSDFYGQPSIDYLSIQYRSSYIRSDYPDPRYPNLLGDLRAGTSAAGKPLALMGDELEWVLPSDDESYSLGIYAKCGMKWHRKAQLWQWYLSGGAGVEYIVETLLNTHDFRQYEPMWRYTRYARNFMEQIPFGDMVPSHDLLTGESTYAKSNPPISGVVLAKPGEVYAIQLPNASNTGTLDLSGAPGTFTKRWYNPRTGNFEGGTETISGGGPVPLGPPPSSSSEDWVVLVEKVGTSPGTLEFSAVDYPVAEGDAGARTVTVAVRRTGGTLGAVSVDYSTSDGTATLGDNDYGDTWGTLNWADGDGSNKTFAVTVNGDVNVENREYFNLVLSNATGGATVGPQSMATVTIIDDDGVLLGWSYQAWTNDATSGIDGSYAYTAAHHFCDAHTGGVVVNGVDFTTGRVTSGTGWNIGGATYWTKDTSVNITGDSAHIADQFVYGGTPRTVQFTGLTIGATYKASFFSVGWEDSGRVQIFSSEGDDLVLDQDLYGNNNGIVISYTYVATAASQNFTIAPLDNGGTFHLYALANREVPVEFIDFRKFANLAEYWMMSGCDQHQPCDDADWFDDDIIDLKDLYVFCSNWLGYASGF